MTNQPSTVLPYLLCEIANVHGGDEAYLHELITKFGEFSYPRKGIKLQVFKPDKIALPDFEWYPVYEELYFSEAVWKTLIRKAAALGDVWIDVFDIYSTAVIRDNIDEIAGLKLQASILENVEVLNDLRTLNLKNKYLIINISGIEFNSIYSMVERFELISQNLILQVGFQAYPTAIESTGLQKISVLKTAFPHLSICMADHADASTEFALKAPVYASLMGCEYIEKHFCLSRKNAKYDAFSSLEPDQVEELCCDLFDLTRAKSGCYLTHDEAIYLEKSIQIPVLSETIGAGNLIGMSDLLYRRTSQKGLSYAGIVDMQADRMILASSVQQASSVQKSDFRPAKIAAIVAGRMKSSRLPKKAILPIAGVASVERCLEQCAAIQGVDQVILATSDLDDDAVLKDYVLNGRADLWRGDPDDVIGRYLGACEAFDVDVVVRVTADCPLVLPEILGLLIEKHFESGADYTAAAECAVGSSGEVINTAALKRVADYFGRAELSEYMTWYFRNNPEFFKLNIVDLPENLKRDYRMTLDYPEDLAMFEALFSGLDSKAASYSAEAVFDVLDQDPAMAAINGHLTLRYKTDQVLIDLLNEKTRMK
ncbi:cytidylyltransferase domain-containing protein [Mariprofundus ferrooxydans]|uniref:cytidylyltransferase domain-containing protein n=1 Tax=Mariprofundus ferrooxydans TaxID=314344 RepID=UPI0003693EA5|nr:N-acetylneuraminate synthase family protein [Mariprofundus ferrooxydans]